MNNSFNSSTNQPSQYQQDLQRLKARKEALLRSKGLTNTQSVSELGSHSEFDSRIDLTKAKSIFNHPLEASASSLNSATSNYHCHTGGYQSSRQATSTNSPMRLNFGHLIEASTSQAAMQSQEHYQSMDECGNHLAGRSDGGFITQQQTTNRGTSELYKAQIEEQSDEDLLTPQDQSILTSSCISEQKSLHVLDIKDHLTNAEALDFWYCYFSSYDINQVPLEVFCEAIQSEYSLSVIKQALESETNIEIETLLQDFYEDLATKISIDQECVSVNAFELFTRSRGLKAPLVSLLSDCLMRYKSQRSMILNDTIVAELSDVKSMLDQKSKQLSYREAELKKKETQFVKMKNQAMKDLEALYQAKLQETELRFKQETKTLMKKWTMAEKSIKDKLKSLQNQKSLSQTQADQTQQPNELLLKQSQMKQRFGVLEKSYEHLKQKSAGVEEQARDLAQQNMKLQEELTKMKQTKKSLTKEINELKLTQSQVMKVQELQVAEITVEKEKAVKEEKKVQSVVAEAKLTSMVFRTLAQTLPLVMQTEDADESRQMESAAVNFGELLFPNFNSLVLQMFEFLPTFDSQMIAVFGQMVTFAFKTQIFEKQIPLFLKVRQVTGIMNALQSTGTSQRPRPYELDYQTLPKRLVQRRDEIKKAQKTQRNAQVPLPLYQLFKDPTLHSVFAEDLNQLDPSLESVVTLSLKLLMSPNMQDLSQTLQKLKKYTKSEHMVEYCLEIVLLCLHLQEVKQQSTTLLLALAFDSSEFVQAITSSLTMFEVFEASVKNNPQDSDLIVVLQKITAKEPALVQNMLSVGTIEKLNELMNIENSTDDFLKQNVKSVLRLIADQSI